MYIYIYIYIYLHIAIRVLFHVNCYMFFSRSPADQGVPMEELLPHRGSEELAVLDLAVASEPTYK